MKQSSLDLFHIPLLVSTSNQTSRVKADPEIDI